MVTSCDAAQIVALMPRTIDIEWPSALRGVFELLDALSLNVPNWLSSSKAIQCAYQLPYFEVLSATLTAALSAAAGLVLWGAAAVALCHKRRPDLAPLFHSRCILASVLALLATSSKRLRGVTQR